MWNLGKILKDDKNKETDKLRKNKTPYITVLFYNLNLIKLPQYDTSKASQLMDVTMH